jgi:hypothetical protein
MPHRVWASILLGLGVAVFAMARQMATWKTRAWAKVSEAQEAKQLRDENTRLKKLVVDLSLDKEMLKAVIAKNGWSS